MVAEIEQALEDHELIKVKVPEEERELRQQMMAAIVRETGAEQVQVIGKTQILFRPAKEPRMRLPRA